MNRGARILLPLSAIATAFPASMASGQGKPMFPVTKDSRRQGALLIRQMGSCLYGKEREGSLKFLRTVPGSDLESRWVHSFQSRLDQRVNGDSEAVRSSAFILRGAVAEGILLAKYPKDPDDMSDGAGKGGLPTSWMEAFSKDPSIGPMLSMHQMATCVVRAAPAGAFRLIRSDPGSAEEAASFGALAPHLGPCVNQGRQFSSNKVTLRALIAEALFDRFVGVDAIPATAH